MNRRLFANLRWWYGLVTDADAPKDYCGPLGRLHLAVIPVAAWWYEHVISYSVASSFDPIWHTVDKIAPGRGYGAADFLTVKVIAKLLGEWPIWPIARDYLQAKWARQDEETNRLWHAEHPEGWSI